MVETKVRSHAQKYFSRVKRDPDNTALEKEEQKRVQTTTFENEDKDTQYLYNYSSLDEQE